MVVPSDLGRPRPGIIVQANETIAGPATVLVCPLSSDLQEYLSLRPVVEVTSENGLGVRSQIMTDKLLALRRDRIRRVIGRVDAETSERLDRALLVLLGLTR
jgi:mRNA interferase MazF